VEHKTTAQKKQMTCKCTSCDKSIFNSVLLQNQREKIAVVFTEQKRKKSEGRNLHWQKKRKHEGHIRAPMVGDRSNEQLKKDQKTQFVCGDVDQQRIIGENRRKGTGTRLHKGVENRIRGDKKSGFGDGAADLDRAGKCAISN
jgi:hypothetical protein